LRFNFVVAAYLDVRFTPQFLRAWHCRGERCSPEIGRPPDALTIETIVLKTFYEIIKLYLNVGAPVKTGRE